MTPRKEKFKDDWHVVSFSPNPLAPAYISGSGYGFGRCSQRMITDRVGRHVVELEATRG